MGKAILHLNWWGLIYRFTLELWCTIVAGPVLRPELPPHGRLSLMLSRQPGFTSIGTLGDFPSLLQFSFELVRVFFLTLYPYHPRYEWLCCNAVDRHAKDSSTLKISGCFEWHFFTREMTRHSDISRVGKPSKALILLLKVQQRRNKCVSVWECGERGDTHTHAHINPIPRGVTCMM